MISAQRVSNIYKTVSSQQPYAQTHQLDKYDTDFGQQDKNSPKFKDMLKKEIAKKELKEAKG